MLKYSLCDMIHYKSSSVGTSVTAKKVELKKYSLVSFTGEVTPEGLKEVDCVPSSWIKYDHELCSCVVQYPRPPYTEEDKRLIQDLIVLQAAAPADWPWYPIELRGHAETYEIDIDRIKVLKKRPYAYSPDSETHAKAKAKKITDVFNTQRTKVFEALGGILSISDNSNSSGDEDDLNSELDYIGGTTSEETPTIIIKRKSNSQKGKKVTGSKTILSQGKRRQPQNQSRTDTTVKNSTSVGSKKSCGPTGISTTSKPQAKDDLSKSESTSKPILETIKKQAANRYIVSKETVLSMEKNAEIEKNLSRASPAMQEMIKDFPQDTALIYLAVKKLTIEVSTIASDLKALQNTIEKGLKSKVDHVSIVTFVEKYNFEKFSTIADFETSEERLEDVEYVKDLKIAMECLLDSDLQRTITGIIKKFFHRVFALQCTAFRKSKDKFLLKGTRFYDLLFDMNLVHRFLKGTTGGLVTDKDFYQTLSFCLTNAKDWEGNKKIRAVPRTATPQAVVVPEE